MWIIFQGEKKIISEYFDFVKPLLFKNSKDLTKKMESRGGGIYDIQLIDKTSDLKGYYQLFATFNTVDAMGANFINSCLEDFSKTFYNSISKFKSKELKEKLQIYV